MTRGHAYHGAELLLDRAQDWRDEARCLGMDPEVFFPHESGSAEPAKAICAECDVREQCLTFAIDNRIDHGIYGGLNKAERDKLRKVTGKSREHKCTVCGEMFTAEPRARPLYCLNCRPAQYQRRIKKYDAKRPPGWNRTGQ